MGPHGGPYLYIHRPCVAGESACEILSSINILPVYAFHMLLLPWGRVREGVGTRSYTYGGVPPTHTRPPQNPFLTLSGPPSHQAPLRSSKMSPKASPREPKNHQNLAKSLPRGLSKPTPEKHLEKALILRPSGLQNVGFSL